MLFPQQLFERIHLKHAFGQEPLEPGILLLQFFEALGFGDRHAAKLFAPAIEGAFRDTVRPTDCADRLVALFGLLQDLDNLFGGVLTGFHACPPSGGL